MEKATFFRNLYSKLKLNCLGGLPVRYLADDEKSAVIEVKSMSSVNGGSSAASFAFGRAGGGGSTTAPMRRKPKRRPPRHFDDSVLNTST